jgi:hypothetical protein
MLALSPLNSHVTWIQWCCSVRWAAAWPAMPPLLCRVIEGLTGSLMLVLAVMLVRSA